MATTAPTASAGPCPVPDKSASCQSIRARSHVLASRPIRKRPALATISSATALCTSMPSVRGPLSETSSRSCDRAGSSGTKSSRAPSWADFRPESALDRLPLNQARAGQRRCGRPIYLAPDNLLGLSSGAPSGCSRRRCCRAGRCCGGIRMALVTWWPSDELIRTKMLPYEVS